MCSLPCTVKVHVKNILRKLHANDGTQAVAIGIQRGLLDAWQMFNGMRYLPERVV